ncbi:hypothetical protein NQ315_009374 [Exocentrus adspersus]|uniref:Prostaglandin reductase 1 n=1 Tax=Exocentrus adspersus TaxID=1586481 RepID=A0AAV8WHE1_9CUCU|nr:hypothetical protein NQ315_009374 [Exocentrus adspersus]
MRAYAPSLKLGEVFIGVQVAKIIESKHPKFPVGQLVTCHFGWRTHTISDGSPIRGVPPMLVPDLGDLPSSLALGIFGRPGNSAYFGFLELCNPKVGETVVVSGAAGAVGSHVGQIGKIKGCKVIGIAGSDEKGNWLKKDLKFDDFINYKTEDLDKRLTELCPEGVDCYFDNVGGETSSIVLSHMNLFGRISVCGSISGYNELVKATPVQRYVVPKQLRMEGFVINRWMDRWPEAIQQNLKWVNEGKLKYRETVTEGFENMFTAFVEMLKGSNFGKAIVKA